MKFPIGRIQLQMTIACSFDVFGIDTDICWVICDKNGILVKMSSLREIFANLSIGNKILTSNKQSVTNIVNRFYKNQAHEIPTPKPGAGPQYRR